ncbi:bis(5'-adenosyl)-triphosphatase enpp4-like [Lingula anatina]|uniref:Bis(5'-adenosyl)-triphosphatase enpp4-like n=1 Tax=Lingula anatina TaxID=7574 RepID=A0A2R2ML56_LINAN|nr:bis(5'-adenosyl)-triphosphatase enpp4-like [Lingula anatina]|eukprot:XP_023930802.1 bis(5'-adenosyl)-triphosphatase enpp4-like [Lingula anatina]
MDVYLTANIVIFIIFLYSEMRLARAEYTEKLLLLSFDGFRWDYLDKVETPFLDYIAGCGAKAPYINGTFITKTFPSHYTIATGLYEESHGIIGNTMYDPIFDEVFSIKARTGKEGRWWGGEPIWLTVKKQHKVSGTYFWPGSDVSIQNENANMWFNYNQNTPYEDRVNKMVSWFKGEDKIQDKPTSFNFVAMYYHEPDFSGHQHGPDSAEVEQAVKDVDRLIGYLLNKLRANNLLEVVNIIITSDHGMTKMSQDKIITLTDYVTVSDVERVPDHGPICNILPNKKDQDAKQRLYNQLKDAHPNMTVYLKEDIPDIFHYKNNRRVMPILAIADEGWVIRWNQSFMFPGNGTHGYDNRYMSMKPIFMAMGPNFKEGITVNPFKQVDIYPLMCQLLNVQPAANNGSLASVSSMLRNTPSEVHWPPLPKSEETTAQPDNDGSSEVNQPLTRTSSPIEVEQPPLPKSEETTAQPDIDISSKVNQPLPRTSSPIEVEQPISTTPMSSQAHTHGLHLVDILLKFMCSFSITLLI